jgi:hypothetical protein
MSHDIGLVAVDQDHDAVGETVLPGGGAARGEDRGACEQAPPGPSIG